MLYRGQPAVCIPRSDLCMLVIAAHRSAIAYVAREQDCYTPDAPFCILLPPANHMHSSILPETQRAQRNPRNGASALTAFGLGGISWAIVGVCDTEIRWQKLTKHCRYEASRLSCCADAISEAVANAGDNRKLLIGRGSWGVSELSNRRCPQGVSATRGLSVGPEVDIGPCG